MTTCKRENIYCASYFILEAFHHSFLMIMPPGRYYRHSFKDGKTGVQESK